ncbi:MAG: polysaccharide deacetylase family protein [Sedimentisphaerales bacterium]|nr:polysaccharide deacetylase family protein [Sedimentisphaerales bacterium]
MKRKVLCMWLVGAAAAFVLVHGWGDAQTRDNAGTIKLVVRADDIGSCHAANLACIRCYREGIVKSVEIQVCCPWFNEAVKMLRENPGLDVGVHLTLTSEWENYRWGPLTQALSLVDAQGDFYPTTSQRPDFPPNTGFLQCGWKIDEVEKELRAQIELARKMIPQVSHLSSHMGTPTCTPELRALVQRLAKEYDLPIETPGAQYLRWAADSKASAEQREAALIKALEALKPGVWIVIEHPGLNTPEMQAMGHNGYWEVASHRDGVTKSFTSPRVKEAVQKRNIQLVSYRDMWPSQP